MKVRPHVACEVARVCGAGQPLVHGSADTQCHHLRMSSLAASLPRHHFQFQNRVINANINSKPVTFPINSMSSLPSSQPSSLPTPITFPTSSMSSLPVLTAIITSTPTLAQSVSSHQSRHHCHELKKAVRRWQPAHLSTLGDGSQEGFHVITTVITAMITSTPVTFSISSMSPLPALTAIITPHANICTSPSKSSIPSPLP